MSNKVYDKKNRWRGVTVSFRASAEESELLSRKAYLCGITKQQYIIDRLLEDKVRMVVNRKVLHRLAERLDILTAAVQTEANSNVLDDVSVEELKFILRLISEIRQEEGKL